MKVSPKHAEIISLHHKTKRIGKLRYSERILRLNDKVYVLGNAKIDKSHQDTLEIRGKKGEKPFLITNIKIYLARVLLETHCSPVCLGF